MGQVRCGIIGPVKRYMKVLYLSCHAILEYDELKLFEELGIDWFSLGSYINPQAPQDNKRPAIDSIVKDHFLEIAIQYDKDNLSPHLIEWADVIVVMHITEWITKNLEKLKGKKIVWRTIGQSTPDKERDLGPYREQIKIVRYSPKEQLIPSFIGQDAMIRFYKDENELKDWNGNSNQVISLMQSPVGRGLFVRYDLLEELTQGFPRAIYGTETEQMSWGKGRIGYEDMKKVLRDSRVFLYTGTFPASYTLSFIEAWMTGIPIVAIGKDLASPSGLVEPFQTQPLYEVHELIQNGVNGFIADDIASTRSYIDQLLKDKELATRIGKAGRESAIAYFGKDVVKAQWKAFFESL